MKAIKQTAAVALLSLVSLSAQAEEITYSTEGYCILAKEGVTDGYLKAYAKKLGQEPSARVCRSFNEFVASAKPKDWDYRGGKPYPGSVIRLSKSQIDKIKAAKKKK